MNIGDRFGKLTVAEYLGHGQWLCHCDCGKDKITYAGPLNEGTIKSCGCLPRGRKPISIAPGDRYGSLVVQSLDGRMVTCRCDCGNEITVSKYRLFSNKVTHCGCKNPKQKREIKPGARYDSLTVLSIQEDGMVLCQCECGNTVLKKKSYLYAKDLNHSCGCLSGRTIRPGARFDSLTILSIQDDETVLCRCDCGKTVLKKKSYLRSKQLTHSCGCRSKEMKKKQRREILPGARYGKLTVLKEDEQSGNVLCRCDCGKEKAVSRRTLLNGRTRSCGCTVGKKRRVYKTGERFGRLTVLEDNGDKILCQCDCGKVKSISRCNLASGASKSCGCQRGKNPYVFTPGEKYGKWTVLNTTDDKKVLCQCACGRIRSVARTSLKAGFSQSCGCGRRGTRKPRKKTGDGQSISQAE